MFVLSTFPTKFSHAAMKEKLKNSSGMVGLSMSATVLMIAIFFMNFYTWRAIYGLVIAFLTEIVTSVFMIMAMRGTAGDQFKFPFMIVLAVLWTIGVIVRKYHYFPKRIYKTAATLCHANNERTNALKSQNAKQSG